MGIGEIGDYGFKITLYLWKITIKKSETDR